jgi:hypothetical protein
MKPKTSLRSLMDLPISTDQMAIDPGTRGIHESCFRSFHILRFVKQLLEQNTPPAVIYDLIEGLEEEEQCQDGLATDVSLPLQRSAHIAESQSAAPGDTSPQYRASPSRPELNVGNIFYLPPEARAILGNEDRSDSTR